LHSTSFHSIHQPSLHQPSLHQPLLYQPSLHQLRLTLSIPPLSVLAQPAPPLYNNLASTSLFPLMIFHQTPARPPSAALNTSLQSRATCMGAGTKGKRSVREECTRGVYERSVREECTRGVYERSA
jgi:hypothetical protein